MGKIKLFPTTEYSSKQSSDPVVPLVPCTGIFLGPSKSGPVTLRHMRFRLTDLDGNVVRLRGSSLSFVLYLDHI